MHCAATPQAFASEAREMFFIAEVKCWTVKGVEGQSDRVDRRLTHSKKGEKPSTQQGAFGGPKGHNGGGSQYGQVKNARMDHGDEEERLKAMLLREIQPTSHKMVHVLEVKGGQDMDILPSQIFQFLCCQGK